MAGFNHPKGQMLCCFQTLPSPLQRSLIDAGVAPVMGMKLLLDPSMPPGIVEVMQNGKKVGAIINLGPEGGYDER